MQRLWRGDSTPERGPLPPHATPHRSCGGVAPLLTLEGPPPPRREAAHQRACAAAAGPIGRLENQQPDLMLEPA